MTGERFRVELSRPAVRVLGRLRPKLVDAVLRFVDGPLLENPLRATKPLGAELEGLSLDPPTFLGWCGVAGLVSFVLVVGVAGLRALLPVVFH